VSRAAASDPSGLQRGARAQDSNRLLRYRSIIDDWDAFLAVIRAPLPFVVRANTLKILPSVLEERLAGERLPVRRLPWIEEAFELPEPPGSRIEHWLGLYYVQESVQLLPVLALSPEPGETVLDLCAAPGGKATFLAARMENQGTLVANEPSGRRQMSLLANLNRLGVLNAMITAYQGENYPMQTSFDRILVDAPCSAEGTLRKESSLQRGASQGTIERLARIQKRLILKAFDLLTPSGTLVYSTCTFAPEENESVVAHLLEQREARIPAFEPPIPRCAGLRGWMGEHYPEDMERCVRVYPHHLDSGGGFIARIGRS
jgi:NOL1/NOP2/sun family putative RNA methylase